MEKQREYTFRYLNAEGRFVAIVHAECVGVAEAVAKAVQFLADHYEALEVTVGEETVWRGLRSDALKFARAG